MPHSNYYTQLCTTRWKHPGKSSAQVKGNEKKTTLIMRSHQLKSKELKKDNLIRRCHQLKSKELKKDNLIRRGLKIVSAGLASNESLERTAFILDKV